ncbi:MBL fold metallo-hydrolase [Candidatus Woesearchaeota archaeon]|nr:MBL fold metallo-hydrolase [Candidatus Woesearchaeota archaeon]
MIFEQIETGNMQNFSYIVGDEKTKEAAIIDAGWEPERLVKAAEKHGLKVKKILLTHTHFDHVNSLAKLHKLTGAEIFVHEEGARELEGKGIPMKALNDGDEVKIGKVKAKVIYAPGHSPSNVCYLIENKLITGDTLFVENIGRIDLPGASPEDMYESLQKLKKLPDNIKVYPGHDYGSKKNSTIGYEKKHNPFMKASRQEFFQ